MKDGPAAPTPTKPTDERPAPAAEPGGGERAAVDDARGPRGFDVVKKAAVPADVKRVRKAAQTSESPEAGADKLVRDAEQKYLAAIRILSRDVPRDAEEPRREVGLFAQRAD